MPRDPSRDGWKNKVEYFFPTHFRPFWYLANHWPWLRRRMNRLMMNLAVNKAMNRPHPFSTRCPYTTWDSLTDRSWSGRYLPAKVWDPQPPVEAVAQLFCRPKGKPRLSPKSTLLFASFAQWVTDGFLRTDPVNQLKTTSIHEVAMTQLYGVKPEQTCAVRQRTCGRLKSQLIRGEEYAPYLYEDDGTTVRAEFSALPALFRLDPSWPIAKRRTMFAFAGDRANLTALTAMMNTLFLREHNRICGVLQQKNPTWDDERLFQTARNILIVILIKIVVEEYINHISPYYFQFQADPSVVWDARWNRQNWIPIEFNLMYRWHSLAPDVTWWPTGEVPTEQTLLNNQMLTDVGLGPAMDSCSRQPAGAIGLFNTAAFLQGTELASIRSGRAAQLAPYNDYREMVGFPRVTHFDQISGDPQTQQALAQLYATPDDIEFYVGLFAEDLRPRAAVPPLMERMVAIDAFCQSLTNPLLAEHVFNANTFTKDGMQIIEETHCLQDLLNRNVPTGAGASLATMAQRRDSAVTAPSRHLDKAVTSHS